MRTAAFVVFVAVILLATCSAPEINPAHAESGMSAPPASTETLTAFWEQPA